MGTKCCGVKKTRLLTFLLAILTVAVIALAIAVAVISTKSQTHHQQYHKDEVSYAVVLCFPKYSILGRSHVVIRGRADKTLYCKATQL